MSDRGPSRGRHSGSRPPKVKQGGSGGGGKSGGGGGGSTESGCALWTFAPPAVCVLAMFLIAAGVVR